jgi:hypothetical protein
VEGIIITAGKMFHGGQTFQEPGIIPLDGFYPGLLKHDLGQPNTVGIPVFSPGQIPSVIPIPGKQCARQFVQFIRTHGHTPPFTLFYNKNQDTVKIETFME